MTAVAASRQSGRITEQATGVATGLATWLLTAAIIVSFCASSMALTAAGLKYDAADGAAWQKLHPATYLAALAMIVNALGQAHPLRYVRALLVKFPGAAYFIAMWMSLTLYGVLVQQAPLTSLIEPYIVALAALFMVDDLAPPSRDFLRKSLHVIVLANALVGIFEFATQTRLFPYVISGELVIGDSRSTAILGHPLLNASTTGAYALCLFLGGDPKVTPVWRVAFIALSLLGLIAFGGRTAIMATSLIIGAKFLWSFALFLLGARVELKRMVIAMLISPLLVIGAVGAAYAGMFDTLIARFIDDNGSGKARVIVLQLFDVFDFGDLLLGPRPDLLVSTLNSFGIEIGIENNWLALMFNYGIWMAGFFIIGLFVLFWEYWRRSRSGASLLFAYFLIIISAMIGLASKTMIFVQFSILLLFIFAPDGAPGGRPGKENIKFPHPAFWPPPRRSARILANHSRGL